MPTKTVRWHKTSFLSFMVTCVSILFIHKRDILIFSVGHLVRHSNIFCRTFIKNVRLSDRSDEFRQHCTNRSCWLLGPHLTRRVPYSNHSVCPSVCLSVCPSKNFYICHNFFTLRDKSFIFGMCDPYDKTFPTVPYILNLWPWLWPLTYFWKTLTLAITFLL